MLSVTNKALMLSVAYATYMSHISPLCLVRGAGGRTCDLFGFPFIFLRSTAEPGPLP
jgi:hypothetical protein